ncbi:MAG: DUF1648 domain-containing protein [Gemmatimonadales bacterium]
MPTSKFQRLTMRGRTAFWAGVALGAAVVLGTIDQLPGTMATRFDAAGRPDTWSSRTGYLVFLAGFGVALPLAIVAMVALFARRAPEWISLPHREIWLAQPRRAEGLARVRAQMWWLACLLALAAIVVHLGVVRAHASDPPRLPLAAALGTIGLVLGGIAIWIVAWHRLFRPPSGSN